ncbi:MAG: hypothetical protein AABW45_00360 [Nanoarchaeota archaeon]
MVKINIIILSMFLLVILSYNVNSFGVSSPYWDENPLYVNPGEIKEITMVLQNMVGDQDMKVIADLDSGKEIASLLDKSTTYNVPLGSSSIPVKIKINVPENAKPGQEWQVGVSFKTIVESSGGVGIGGAVSKGFKVIVKEEPKTTGSVLKIAGGLEPLTGFLVLIAILIILVLIIKHFHKKRVIKE